MDTTRLPWKTPAGLQGMFVRYLTHVTAVREEKRDTSDSLHWDITLLINMTYRQPSLDESILEGEGAANDEGDEVL